MRVVEEGMSEAELAVFDLLTKPAPELTDAELRKVRSAAKDLLDEVEDKLVLDWKKKESSRAGVRVTIRNVLDGGLPDAYDPPLFDEKRQGIYEHFYSAFGNEGESVYDDGAVVAEGDVLVVPTTVEEIENVHVERAKSDVAWHNKLMDLATAEGMAAWDTSVENLIRGDETRAVEFKQTARWNVREEKKDKLMEDVIAKTVAGFANASGGTLLVGVHDEGHTVGLEPDFALVKPPTADGYVNWMDTMLQNRFGFALAQLIRLDMVEIDGHHVCRVDIPAATQPAWTEIKGDRKLFVRRNNSTRAVPAEDIDSFVAQRFGD